MTNLTENDALAHRAALRAERLILALEQEVQKRDARIADLEQEKEGLGEEMAVLRARLLEMDGGD